MEDNKITLAELFKVIDSVQTAGDYSEGWISKRDLKTKLRKLKIDDVQTPKKM